MTSHAIRGSCLCGSVRWEVDGPLAQPDPRSSDPMALLTLSHCHCSRCRKAHGAPYATYLLVPEASFRLTAGREHIVRWESTPGAFRPFCDTCGSVVPDGAPIFGHCGVPAGCCDDDPGLTPTSHIFVASKAPWVTIADDLPRFDAYPGGAEIVPTRAPLDPATGAARGSCLCGEVTYVFDGEVIRSRTCHCSRCRKACSSAHMTYLVTSYDGLRYARGEGNLRRYKVPEAQYFSHVFCATCGSSMPRREADRGISIAPMGSFDDDPGVRPSMHIWVGSKARWDVITDGLPQHEEAPPA